MNKNKITIIIPILNEEQNIQKLTKLISKILKKFHYEIIFVDDSSDDNSVNILKYLKKKYKFFKPIFRKNKNRDLTQSCFQGIKKSRYQNIVIMDGDLQHDPKYILKMYKIFKKEKLDIVIGARNLFVKNKGLSESRRFASNVLIKFFSIFKINTSDPMSGFFLFKKKIYIENKKFFFGKGFKILADFLINSKKSLKTKDISIKFNRRYKNKSKMNFKILILLMSFYLISLSRKLFN